MKVLVQPYFIKGDLDDELEEVIDYMYDVASPFFKFSKKIKECVEYESDEKNQRHVKMISLILVEMPIIIRGEVSSPEEKIVKIEIIFSGDNDG